MAQESKETPKSAAAKKPKAADKPAAKAAKSADKAGAAKAKGKATPAVTDAADLPRRQVQAAGAREGLLPQALHRPGAAARWADHHRYKICSKEACRKPRTKGGLCDEHAGVARAGRGAPPRLRRPPKSGRRCRRSSSAAARACAGEVRVSGAKNAALPILASSLLARGRSIYRNVPALGDVRTMGRAARAARRRRHRRAERGTAHVDTVDDQRASRRPTSWSRRCARRCWCSGPLVARYGQARVSLPGGCAIGARPIDQHLKGLEAMGAQHRRSSTATSTPRRKRLRGATIVFDMPTVTGTENLMMAAALAQGAHHARERRARARGRGAGARAQQDGRARSSGAGTVVITIEGVDELQPDRARHHPRSHRGRHASWSRRRITRGDVLVRDCLPEHLEAVIAKLRAAGAEVDRRGRRPPRARQAPSSSRSTSRRSRTPASRPTCRRSSWC